GRPHRDRAAQLRLEHDPEKWVPVFGKRSCSKKKLERDDDSKKSHPGQGSLFPQNSSEQTRILEQIFDLRGLGMVIYRQPCGKRRGPRFARLQLTKRHPYRGATETIAFRRDGERLMSGADAVHDTLLERKPFGINISLQQCLKCKMTLGIELTRTSMIVAYGIRRVAMGARHHIIGQRLSCRVRTSVREQLGQDVRVRSIGAYPVRRRNGLEHLDAPDVADKDAMRVCAHNHA